MSDKRLADALRRIKELEAILVCTDCGHLRSEHHDGDAPCYGGRTPDMEPGEGEYCGCDGFQSEA